MTIQTVIDPYPTKPWWAAALAVLLGPLGLLYTSSILAVAALILFLLLLQPIVTSVVGRVSAVLLCGTAAYFWVTRRPDLGRFPRLAKFDRPGWMKAGVLVAGMLGLFLFITRTVHTAMSLGGPSMSPTVLAGEWVYTVLAPALREPITRGTVVRYEMPEFGSERKRQLSISRVAALEGDQVEIKLGRFFVNGRLADDLERISALEAAGCLNLQVPTNNEVSAMAFEGSQKLLPGNIVPTGFVFILSDNRSDLFADSRALGPIPLSAVRGVVHPIKRNPSGLAEEDCALSSQF